MFPKVVIPYFETQVDKIQLPKSENFVLFLAVKEFILKMC